MEKLQKQILTELDELISRAPDIDMETEYQHFRQTHTEVLMDASYHPEGLAERLLLVSDILRFQHCFLKNCDISKTLNDVLITAKAFDREDLIKCFFDKDRMQQMFYILEKRGITDECESKKKSSKKAS